MVYEVIKMCVHLPMYYPIDPLENEAGLVDREKAYDKAKSLFQKSHSQTCHMRPLYCVFHTKEIKQGRE